MKLHFFAILFFALILPLGWHSVKLSATSREETSPWADISRREVRYGIPSAHTCLLRSSQALHPIGQLVRVRFVSDSATTPLCLMESFCEYSSSKLMHNSWRVQFDDGSDNNYQPDLVLVLVLMSSDISFLQSAIVYSLDVASHVPIVVVSEHGEKTMKRSLFSSVQNHSSLWWLQTGEIIHSKCFPMRVHTVMMRSAFLEGKVPLVLPQLEQNFLAYEDLFQSMFHLIDNRFLQTTERSFQLVSFCSSMGRIAAEIARETTAPIVFQKDSWLNSTGDHFLLQYRPNTCSRSDEGLTRFDRLFRLRFRGQVDVVQELARSAGTFDRVRRGSNVHCHEVVRPCCLCGSRRSSSVIHLPLHDILHGHQTVRRCRHCNHFFSAVETLNSSVKDQCIVTDAETAMIRRVVLLGAGEGAPLLPKIFGITNLIIVQSPECVGRWKKRLLLHNESASSDVKTEKDLSGSETYQSIVFHAGLLEHSSDPVALVRRALKHADTVVAVLLSSATCSEERIDGTLPDFLFVAAQQPHAVSYSIFTASSIQGLARRVGSANVSLKFFANPVDATHNLCYCVFRKTAAAEVASGQNITTMSTASIPRIATRMWAAREWFCKQWNEIVQGSATGADWNASITVAVVGGQDRSASVFVLQWLYSRCTCLFPRLAQQLRLLTPSRLHLAHPLSLCRVSNNRVCNGMLQDVPFSFENSPCDRAQQKIERCTSISSLPVSRSSEIMPNSTNQTVVVLLLDVSLESHLKLSSVGKALSSMRNSSFATQKTVLVWSVHWGSLHHPQRVMFTNVSNKHSRPEVTCKNPFRLPMLRAAVEKGPITPSPKVALVTHIYNEEFILPFFIFHHAHFFTVAHIIDFRSTDASLALLRKYAPESWTVEPSDVDTGYFGAQETDAQLLRIERSLPEGWWKFCPTIAEFLISPDIQEELQAAADQNYQVLRVPGALLIGNDSVPLRSWESHHLLPQRSMYVVKGDHWRFIHRVPNCSVYAAAGRHFLLVEAEIFSTWTSCSGFAKFSYTPWPEARQRKTQIAPKIPKTDLAVGMGKHHVFSSEKLDKDREFALRTRRVDMTEVHPDSSYSIASYGVVHRAFQAHFPELAFKYRIEVDERAKE